MIESFDHHFFYLSHCVFLIFQQQVTVNPD